MSSPNRARVILASIGIVAAGPAASQGLCLSPTPGVAAPPAASTEPDALEFTVGRFHLDVDEGADLGGRVEVNYDGGILSAERMFFDQGTESVDVEGRALYSNEELSVFGEDAHLDHAANELSFAAAGFDLPLRPARGSAERIRLTSARTMSLEALRFTTCPEDDTDWEFIAREVEMRMEDGYGTARGVRFKFKNVPIFYTPYFTFPIDDRRKSGFLTPRFAEHERTGLDVSVPYYFNLAPNYDLTVEPRYLSKRGLQVNSDFRYLLPRSDGEFRFDYLPNDDQTHENRGYLDLEHESRFGAGWQFTAGIEEVSDDAYFEDMGNSLSVTSQTHLNRFLDLGFFAQRWSVRSRFQNYQTIDELIAPEDRPYERIPQILFEGLWAREVVSFDSTTEVVNFDREIGVTGWRLDSTQELSLRFARAGMYLKPAVAWRQTNYWLDNTGAGEETFDRGLPIASVDSGIQFEREAGKRGRWLQTLEPRLLYVNVPYEDQSGLPVFDTIVPDFNLVQLFRKYQFVGPDRIADTDQLSFGITTRLVDGTDGGEKLSATLGQTRYLNTQSVNLPGQVLSGASASDYLAELGISLSAKWNLDVGYQWNSETSSRVRSETRFEYRPQDDRIFGLGYRFREGLLEQGDFSMVWPMGKSWRFIGQYSYSLLEGKPLEQFVGLAYEACCWRLQIVGRRYISRSTGQTENGFSIQLGLKGLSQRTTTPEEMLDRGILGYRRFGGAGSE